MDCPDNFELRWMPGLVASHLLRFLERCREIPFAGQGGLQVQAIGIYRHGRNIPTACICISHWAAEAVAGLDMHLSPRPTILDRRHQESPAINSCCLEL